MARLPSRIEMIGGKSPRQRIWEAIRKLHGQGKSFTRQQIEQLTSADVLKIKGYFNALIQSGFIAIHEQRDVNESFEDERYKLIKDNGIEAPRFDKQGKLVTEGNVIERMWDTMRRMYVTLDFNHRELAATASTSGSICSEAAAKSYVLFLAHAEYLEIIQPGRKGNKAELPRYRLRRDKITGPRAPKLRQTKCVYDPNLDKVMWQEHRGECDE